MQALFTCVPGHGHLNPMVPLARELVSRGCDVVFATGPQLVARVEQLGFRSLAAGPTLSDMQTNALADPTVRAALETEPWVVAAAIFGGRAHFVLEDLRVEELAPDLVIHDAMDLAGPVVAAIRGVPWITHGLGPRWPSLVEDAIPTFVDDLWRAHGLDPVAAGGLGHHAYVEICPPAVRSDNGRDDDRVVECRAVPLEEPAATMAMPAAPDRPRVYCTLGTFSNSNVAVFRTVLDALAAVEVDALLTTGWGVERDGLGPIPPNVQVEEYVPQAQVLEHVDAVVCHGGSGTVLAALGSGRPVVIAPQGADQFINAPWWSRSGAATVIDAPDLDAEALAAAISATIQSSSMHRAAEAVARDMAAMPLPAAVADELIARADR